MYTITAYSVSLTSGNVTVGLSYELMDPLEGQIRREGAIVLIDGVGALTSPTWGDDDLCAAVADKLGIPASEVVMEERYVPPAPEPPPE